MKDIGHCTTSCDRIKDVLARIGDKWSLLVIIALKGTGVMRFNELKRHLGVSQRMLSITLRELERDGLVTRTAYPTVPPTVEYQLTTLGESFGMAVRTLSQWAIDNLDEIDTARADYDAAQQNA
ncbi:winged helix-turn-helix transcriptional regulator [Pseudoprimorskyibacter insulae]|uniref:HTH-type transcriptional activator HxlR n=1 Tax=Pseudoprimorskyibacter insulae TaxID=1695997 RepID=A0A2R8AYF9_9RHOB|nr:helix-turn-helix domain-containing protein [Pseudoprimorskyibacter insulae]SPF81075.1 HTH-type transcriptional activator HxlR [Pseudoprimorskyibacter insulae]